jgi:hypothetical protein
MPAMKKTILTTSARKRSLISFGPRALWRQDVLRGKRALSATTSIMCGIARRDIRQQRKQKMR